jgi:ABC-2 type transport system permease protein
MTLRHSFLKRMKEDSKRRIWIMVLSLYLFAMLLLETIAGRGGDGGLLWGGDDRLGPGNLTVMGISILLGVLCGLQGFSYLFSQEKTDFYFSLPVKRRTLFFSAYLNGFLIFAIPCIFARLACLVIKDPALSGESISSTMTGILVSFVGYLLIYNITILSVLLTGNIVIAVGLLAFFFFYMTVTFGFVIQMYGKMFFQTFYQIDWLDGMKLYFSPLSLYEKMAGIGEFTLDGEKWSLAAHLPYLLAALGMGALLLLVLQFLFYRRPAEASGKPIAFTGAQPVIRMLFVIPLGLISGYFFRLCGGDESSFLWVTAGILAGVFTFHGLAEVIFQFRFRGMITHQKQMLLTAALCILIAGSFYLDVWKYDSYLPRNEEVLSVSLSVKGVDDKEAAEGYAVTDDRTDPMAESRMRHMELTGENKKAALQWIQKLSEGIQAKGETFTYVTAAYHMKNGGDIYRQYPVMDQGLLTAFSPIYESEEYKNGTVSLLSYGTEDIENGYEFVWSNGADSLTPDLTLEEKEELFERYRKELKGLTMEEAMRETPLGILTFSKEGGANGGSAYLYPSFTKTIGFLKDKGIPADKSIRNYEIKEIVVTTWEKNSSLFENSGRGTVKKEYVQDRNEIENLQKHMVYKRCAVQPLMQPFDENTEYQAVIKGEKGETINRVNCVLVPSDT